jgi:hypothetical protein
MKGHKEWLEIAHLLHFPYSKIAARELGGRFGFIGPAPQG